MGLDRKFALSPKLLIQQSAMKTGIFPGVTSWLFGVFLLLHGHVMSADLYVSNGGDGSIKSITPEGTISTFATGFNNPQGLAFDAAGNLYVANGGDNTIRKVTADGHVSTFADLSTSPWGLAIDRAGNLYASAANAGAVLKVSPGGTINTFATGFSTPTGLTFDVAGNLYVANGVNGVINKVTPSGAVSVFATGFQFPVGLTFDSSSNLFAANNLINTVSKITPSGQVSLFASDVHFPGGIIADADDNLYIALIAQGTIKRISPGGEVTIFVTGLREPHFVALRPTANSPPSISCPTNEVIECAAPARLSALVSDPEGDALVVSWSVNGMVIETTTIPANSPPFLSNVVLTNFLHLGTNAVEITVSDTASNTTSCTFTVTVIDRTPPVIVAASASPTILWPPDHKMLTVRINALVSDICGPTTWKIISVASNEPTDSHDNGRGTVDWRIIDDHTVQLRAERSGTGRGRVYSVTIQATDGAGNVSDPATVTVTVPKEPTRQGERHGRSLLDFLEPESRARPGRH